MTRIGLLSDTHSYLDKRFFELFKEVDEIWHAGDIGDIRVLDELRNFKLTRAVFGNIDDAVLRKELNEHVITSYSIHYTKLYELFDREILSMPKS